MTEGHLHLAPKHCFLNRVRFDINNKRKIFSYWLTLRFREVEGKENGTYVFHCVCAYRIVCLTLGQSSVEGLNTYDHKHILKVLVTGPSLHLIGLANERTCLGR